MILSSTINVSRSDHASWLPTENLRDYLTPLLVWVGSISDRTWPVGTGLAGTPADPYQVLRGDLWLLTLGRTIDGVSSQNGTGLWNCLCLGVTLA